MKIGIFSDIHSNLEALVSVLEDMYVHDITHTLCLGDIVGYSANPKECLDTVRTLGCPVIQGNHDEMAVDYDTIEYISPSAHEAIAHTVRSLNPDDVSFLASLPRTVQKWSITAAHDTLDTPGSWNYVVGLGEASVSFTYQRTRVCFIGHTHVARVFEKNSSVSEVANIAQPLILERYHKYLVNVGSVGQPRDKDWRASWCEFDADKEPYGVVTIHRVPYDLAKAQSKIRRVGLPSFLAERLKMGL